MKKAFRFLALFVFSWFIASLPSGFAIISLPEKDYWFVIIIHAIVLLGSLYFMYKSKFLARLEN
jgi:hypothetical protein